MTESNVSVACEGRIDTALIPDYVGHNIAQVPFRSILEAWQNPDVQEQYQRWKAARKDGDPAAIIEAMDTPTEVEIVAVTE